MNVGLHRLSPFNVGRRRYAYPTLTQDDLAGVRHAVLCGLGLDRWRTGRNRLYSITYPGCRAL